MSRTLHDAPWLHSDALTAVVTALSTDDQTPRIVGGAVRDGLLGLPVSDIDLATVLQPNDVVKKLEAAGIKAVPTGIDHGTITANANGQNFEVTTLRRDVSTDGRRATVAFSTDWQEDAARRDFTINALYADVETGAVFDYFGGIDDLKVGTVRFIGDAATRIAEDHLRILRYFRFFARFGKARPDAEAIAACAAAAKSLMALSRERIADELMKLLTLADPTSGVDLMVQYGIFAAFLPEISTNAVNRLSRLIEREQRAFIPVKAGRRLSALLPDDRNLVDLVSARLKLSNKARVEMAARLHDLAPQIGTARPLAYRQGIAIATDIILLHGGDDWCEALQQLDGWLPPSFPVKGGELVAMGLNAGPEVASTLQRSEQQWIDEGFPDAERARQIAFQLVAERLSDKKL